MCCLQEVKWRGHLARKLWMNGRHKLCWSGKGDGISVVRAMVKEELCEKVVKVKKLSDDSYCSL